MILVKLTLRIKESYEFNLDAWVMLTSNYEPRHPPMLFVNYAPFPVIYNNRAYFAKIIEAKRLDSYRGDCEDTARKMRINPEICVCDDEFVMSSDQED
jgi:hypothetical protein